MAPAGLGQVEDRESPVPEHGLRIRTDTRRVAPGAESRGSKHAESQVVGPAVREQFAPAAQRGEPVARSADESRDAAHQRCPRVTCSYNSPNRRATATAENRASNPERIAAAS